jgi:hypothetical protein
MMITRRDFGKLGVGAAAVVKISPYLLFSGGDAHGQTTSGEGGDIRRVGARSNGTYWDMAVKGLTCSRAIFPIPLPCCWRRVEVVVRLCA